MVMLPVSWISYRDHFHVLVAKVTARRTESDLGDIVPSSVFGVVKVTAIIVPSAREFPLTS